MMDKSAIQQIQMASVAAVIQASMDEKELNQPTLAIPEGFKIESLECYLPKRARFKGHMRTNSVNDFGKYSLENKQDGTRCFIDKDTESAKVIFNLGDTENAGHGDFSALLELEKTAEYKALLSIHSGHATQKALAEFMEDWADFITCFDSEGEVVHITKAIGAVRRLVIEANAKAEHEVQDFRSSRSAMENIEAKTDTGLPSEILFQCSPFNELPEFNFHIRVSVITGDDKPKFSTRIKRLEKVQDEIMETFKEIVIEKLAGQIPTYLGVFKTIN